jgi:hypothetical protein
MGHPIRWLDLHEIGVADFHPTTAAYTAGGREEDRVQPEGQLSAEERERLAAAVDKSFEEFIDLDQ